MLFRSRRFHPLGCPYRFRVRTRERDCRTWWDSGPSWAIYSLLDQAIIPATLPSAVVSRPPGIRCVIAAGPIQHLLISVSRTIINRFPLIKLLPSVILILAPWRAIALLSLAIASILLILVNCSHLIRTVPVIRPVLSSLVSKILAIISPG